MNLETKKHIWDSVNKKIAWALIGRTIFGVLTVGLQMTALKQLPLILTSMSQNTVPMITGVLGFFLLKERLSIFEISCLLLSFAGVSIMVIGHTQNSAA